MRTSHIERSNAEFNHCAFQRRKQKKKNTELTSKKERNKKHKHKKEIHLLVLWKIPVLIERKKLIVQKREKESSMMSRNFLRVIKKYKENEREKSFYA